jgi:hypothetical protein
LPISAAASDFSNCQVVEIVAIGEQNGHVQLSCTVSSVQLVQQLITFVGFDKSTSAGKQYFAMFLAALATNAKIEGSIDRMSCSPSQGNVPLLTQLRMKRAS